MAKSGITATVVIPAVMVAATIPAIIPSPAFTASTPIPPTHKITHGLLVIEDEVQCLYPGAHHQAQKKSALGQTLQYVHAQSHLDHAWIRGNKLCELQQLAAKSSSAVSAKWCFE
jgi:hypothetical protein